MLKIALKKAVSFRRANIIVEKIKDINPQRVSLRLWSIFRTLLLIGMSFMIMYPFLYMVSNAFKETIDLNDPSVVWIPKHFTTANIKDVYSLMKYPLTIFNTAKIGFVSVILQIISCSLIGYGFARYKFKGRELLFSLVLFTIIVPPQTILIPLFLKYRFFDFFSISSLLGAITGKTSTVNLIGTPWTFYLPSMFGVGLRSGLFIFIFRQFFRGMSTELEDAAKIDGCGPLKTFLQVMVPNALPAFITVILFSMVWHWNEFYMSSLFFNTNFPISVQLAALRDSLSMIGINHYDDYLVATRLQAGCLLTALPPLLIYIFAQKYFTESIERTGIVG